MTSMQAGLHLPQLDLTGEGLSYGRLSAAMDAARECGFAAVSANDHFFFGAPWLDGPAALAAAIERSGRMELATTVSLPTLRGPVPLASAHARRSERGPADRGRRSGIVGAGP
jgi:alkanesulfonate monooxygenase SsuD/methylene tetrahydromethanopterin reductase-like flavin-dependent oxidoreductase (luciferase family)